MPFSLTEAGMIYYKYLENISYNDQQLERDLAPYTEPNKEIIKLGVLESLGSFFCCLDYCLHFYRIILT